MTETSEILAGPCPRESELHVGRGLGELVVCDYQQGRWGLYAGAVPSWAGTLRIYCSPVAMLFDLPGHPNVLAYILRLTNPKMDGARQVRALAKRGVLGRAHVVVLCQKGEASEEALVALGQLGVDVLYEVEGWPEVLKDVLEAEKRGKRAMV